MLKRTYSGPITALFNSLPLGGLAAIPFARPPLGVTPNFENPPTIWIYVRSIIVKKLRWDDALIFIGFFFSIVFFSTIVLGCYGGAAGRHDYDVHLDKVLGHAGLMQRYICTLMLNPAVGFIKMGLIVQYYYVLGSENYIRKSVYIIGTLNAVFYIFMSITAFALLGRWLGDYLDIINSARYDKFAKFSIPGGVVGMLIDWTLLILPIPAVLNLRIPRKKKFAVMLIFMTGGLGAVASILSLYYRVLLQINPIDTTWKVGYTMLWAGVETWSGVTASFMPSVKQFFSYYITKRSPNSSLGPSISHLRRPRRENDPAADSNFGKWGYKSDGDVEIATHIVHASPPCGNMGMEDLIAEGIIRPRDVHVE